MLQRYTTALMLLFAAAAAHAEPRSASESAREHYQAASKYFNLAKYDDAIREFEAAYQAKDDPVFLYNLGQSHRLAGHLELSIRFYRNYLRIVRDVPHREEIESRIAEMERALATQRKQDTVPPMGTAAPDEQPTPKPTPPPAPAPVAPEPAPAPASSGSTLKLAGIGLLAGGVVIGLAGGIGFGLAGADKAAAIRAQADSGAPFDPALDDDRRTFGTLSIVSYLVGGVIAAAGGVLLVLGLRGGGEAKTALRLTPVIGPRGGGLAVGDAF
jgi:tetratricopeptide (TPR) repeat protein